MTPEHDEMTRPFIEHREIYQQRFKKLRRRGLVLIAIFIAGAFIPLTNLDLTAPYVSVVYLSLIFGYLLPLDKLHRQYLDDERTAHDALFLLITLQKMSDR